MWCLGALHTQCISDEAVLGFLKHHSQNKKQICYQGMQGREKSHVLKTKLLEFVDIFAIVARHMCIPGTISSETSHMLVVCKLFWKTFTGSSQMCIQMGKIIKLSEFIISLGFFYFYVMHFTKIRGKISNRWESNHAKYLDVTAREITKLVTCQILLQKLPCFVGKNLRQIQTFSVCWKIFWTSYSKFSSPLMDVSWCFPLFRKGVIGDIDSCFNSHC